MAQTPASSDQPPEDMHWGISYLREDLQDQRQEIRELRREMQDRFARVDHQFATVTERIDAQGAALTARMDSKFNLLLGVTLSSMFALNAMTVGALIYFMQIYLPAS